jgi:hypothetical protein
MHYRHWMGTIALGIGLLWGAIAPGIAIADDEAPAAPAASETGPEGTAVGTPPPLPPGFRTHTLPRAFSIQMPDTWQAEDRPEDRTAILTTYDPPSGDRAVQPGDIRTQVQFLSESPNTAISRAIDELVASGHEVTEYRFMKVNGILALRIRVAEVPGDYPYQFITYIGYASYGTAILVSEYLDPSEEIHALLDQVHGSFVPVYR